MRLILAERERLSAGIKGCTLYIKVPYITGIYINYDDIYFVKRKTRKSKILFSVISFHRK